MYVGACLLFMFVYTYIQYVVFVVHLATLVVCLLFMYVAFTLLYLVVCLLFTYIIMFVLHVYSAVQSCSCCYLFICLFVVYSVVCICEHSCTCIARCMLSIAPGASGAGEAYCPLTNLSPPTSSTQCKSPIT